MEFTHVVLSGGAFKCLTSLGCLRYHEHAGRLSNVQCFVGVSAGAVLGLLLSVGCSTEDIIKVVYQEIIPCALRGIDLDAVFNLPDMHGLDDGAAYTNVLKKVLQSRGLSEDTTFGELYEQTGKRLVVGVTNVSVHTTEYWDLDTQPDTKVIMAVRASIAIPLIFTPVWFQGACYVDGGVLNNFPLEHVPSDALSTTLAIHIVNHSRHQPSRDGKSVWSLLDYVRELLVTVTDRPRTQILCDTLLTIAVDEPTDSSLYCFSVDDLKFGMTSEIARQYIQQGYSVAKCNYETRVKYENV